VTVRYIHDWIAYNKGKRLVTSSFSREFVNLTGGRTDGVGIFIGPVLNGVLEYYYCQYNDVGCTFSSLAVTFP
jgi:hypothetical protein